jgi:GT2 family glycosyltransferase
MLHRTNGDEGGRLIEGESRSPLIELLIVIVNFNTSKLCLNSVSALLPQLPPSTEIVVVDNCSIESERRELLDGLDNIDSPIVTVLLSPCNNGFSAGNNLGIVSRVARYYLLLNSDTIARPGSIKLLLNQAKNSNAEVGIFSPRLEFLDGNPQISCFQFHSCFSEMIDQAHVSLITRLMCRWNVPIMIPDSVIFPEWTSFACVLIKREVFESVGLLDEGYFLYYEDVDFCYQANRYGWEIQHTPTARVAHIRGGSSTTKERIRQRKKLPRYLYESRSRYFAKNKGGRTGLFLANTMWYLGRTICLIKFVFSGKLQSSSKNQYKDIWINFQNPMGCQSKGLDSVTRIAKISDE